MRLLGGGEGNSYWSSIPEYVGEWSWALTGEWKDGRKESCTVVPRGKVGCRHGCGEAEDEVRKFGSRENGWMVRIESEVQEWGALGQPRVWGEQITLVIR